jgi:hypothetical protein
MALQAIILARQGMLTHFICLVTCPTQHQSTDASWQKWDNKTRLFEDIVIFVMIFIPVYV